MCVCDRSFHNKLPLSFFLFFGGDFDIYAFWLTFALGFFFIRAVLLLSIGPYLLQSVTLESKISRPYSDLGSLWDTQQLCWLLYLTMYQKQ